MEASVQDAFARLYPTLDAGLQSPALCRELQAAPVARIPAGQVIFDEQDRCEGFPLLLQGEVRVSKRAANGRELLLYRLAPGEACPISSSCLLGHVAYNARAVTASEVVLRILPETLFEALLAERAFRDFVFSQLADRIAGLMQRVDELAFRRLDQRLAGLLLGKGPVVHTTHQRLADELGSVREIVSRLLKSLAEGGLVRLGREQIEILDPAGLRRLAEEGPVPPGPA